jgi:cell division protein FtsB
MRGAPQRERRPFSKQLRLALLLLVGLAVVSLVGDRGLVRLYQMHQEKAALATEVESLAATIHRLKDEARALRSDASTIEAIAREELGLVKPGDLVFQFSGPESTRAPAGENRPHPGTGARTPPR